jgi:predicted nicotinamide N-methyase
MFANEDFLRALRGKAAPAMNMKQIVLVRNDTPLYLYVSDEAGVGGMVWEAAGVLADWIQSHVAESSKKRFLELGSGTGVLGLCVAEQGMRKLQKRDTVLLRVSFINVCFGKERSL